MAIKITGMALINWHKINTWQKVKLEDFTLITGENYAGKTTLLDAIQTCIYVTPTNFNKANDIDIPKYRRSLLTYMRGMDTVFSEPLRKNCVYTHIACECRDGDEVSVLGFSAMIPSGTNDAAKITKNWWLAKNTSLDDIQATYTDPSGKSYVYSPQEIIAQLGVKKLEKSEAMQAFSKELNLSKTLIGDTSVLESLIKLHKQSVSFNTKKVANVDQYLKEFIFNEEPVDISEYQDSIERQIELQEQLEIIQKKIETLEAISKAAEENDNAVHEKNIRETALLLKERADAEKKITSHTNTIKEKEEERIKLKNKSKDLDLEYQDVSEKKAAFMRETGLDNLKRDLTESEKLVKRAEKARASVTAHNEHIKRFAEKYFDELNLTKEAFVAAEEKFSEKKYHIQTEKETLETKRKELEEEFYNLKSGFGKADPETQKAYNALCAEFEKDGRRQPEYLYRKLECTAPEWQDSAERFLSWQRYDITIAPEDYRAAARFFNDKFPWKRGALLNLENIKEKEAESNSLAAILKTEDEALQKYISAKFGRVILTENIPEERYAEGFSYIDKKGQRYTGNRFSKMNEIPFLLIGEETRKRRLEVVSIELSRIVEEQQKTDRQIADVQQIIEESRDIADTWPTQDQKDLSASLDGEIELYNKRKSEYENVLNSGVKERTLMFEQKLKEIRKEEEEIRNSLVEVSAILKTSEEKIKDTTISLNVINEKLQGVDTREAEEFNANNKKSYAKLQEEIEELRILEGKWQGRLDERLKEYNQKNGTHASKEECIKELNELSCDTMPKVIKDRNDVAKQIRADMIEKIISRLKSDIRKAKQNIRDVNRMLEEITFHGDVYKLNEIKPADGMEDYYKAITRYSSNDGSIDLMSILENELTEEGNNNEILVEYLHQKIIEQMQEKCSANYLDYRTYCKFGLSVRKESESKSVDMQEKFGPASGAEVQIPIYLILGIGIMNKTDTGKYSIRDTKSLRVMCIDEAFEKMDGGNKQAMIQMLTENMGIQLIAVAPFNMLQDFSGYDTSSCILVQTDGNSRFTYNYTIKKTKEIAAKSKSNRGSVA